LNANGSIAWQKTYGGSEVSAEDRVNSIVETSTGEFLVIGSTYSFGAGSADMWLFKTEKDGDLLWEKTYGGSNSDYGGDVKYMGGSIILAGQTKSFGAGGFDFWLLKTDNDGNIDSCDVIGTSNMTVTNTEVAALDTNITGQVSSASVSDITDTPNHTIIAGQQICYVETPTVDVYLPLILK
jgi:hypothetical protein